MSKLKTFLGHVKSSAIKVKDKAVPYLKKGLGSFSYQPPQWWNSSNFRESAFVQKSGTTFRTTRTWIQTHKKVMYSLYAVTAIGAASYGGWHYYKFEMPHPEWVNFSVRAPSPMSIYAGSKPNSLKIEFSRPCADLKNIRKTLDKGISISPKMKGKWFFETDSELVFQPETEWAPGTKYAFSFSKEIFSKLVELRDYEGEFETQFFNLSIYEEEFNQHPTIPKEKKGVFSVRFSHPIDPSTFADKISMQLEPEGGSAKDVRFSVQYSPDNTSAHIHSEFLGIPDRDSKLFLYIQSGVHSIFGGNSTKERSKGSIRVPGMYNYFKIASVDTQVIRNEKFIPEHVLIVRTTAAARSEDVAKKLNMWLLPKDNPYIERQEGEIETWQGPGDVSNDVKKKLVPISLELIPSEFENSEIHTFRYKSELKRYAYVKIDKGIKSFGDYILANTFEEILNIPSFEKELLVMHQGSILTLQGEKKIPVLSRNLSKIQFSIRRMRPNELHHFISQSSGSFQNPDFANSWRFGHDNITESFSEEIDVDISDPAKTNYHSFDFSKYLNSDAMGGARGVFFFSASDKGEGLVSQRFVVLTDLGLLTKTDASGNIKVFVQSFSSGRPVSGAKVEVLALNGTVILSEVTDGDGVATFPTLSGFQREKKAIAFVARLQNDYTFLPLNSGERNLNISRFDVSGLVTQGEADRVQSYLFTDRGIYRPGDQTNFGVITKNLSWRALPEGLPLEFVVTNPAGTVLMREKFNVGNDGFSDFTFSTTEESPTGSYNAQVSVIRNSSSEVVGSVSFKVEEFLPDRMKILTTLSEENPLGWIKGEDLKAKVLLTNLFGTAAQNRRVAAEYRLVPGFPATRTFSEYEFLNPRLPESSYTERLEDGNTNDDGESEFELDLSKFGNASYRLEFVAQGFEAEGGRSVSSSASVFISPAAYVLGFKADGDLHYMRTGDRRKIHLIGVDNKMNKTAVKKLKAKLVEEKYVSVLTQQSNGTYKYQSIKKEVQLGSAKKLEIPAAGLSFDLDTSKDGNFIYVVYDDDGVEFTKISYSVIAPSGLARGLEKNSELQIALNKTDYAKGEEIELQIRAPYTGAGLITIERGHVYRSVWFKTTSESSIQKIRIPEELEGNGYVSVVFLRSIDSKEIYMSPLSYGIAPFTISKKDRMTEISLKSPEIVKPGEKLQLKYSASKPTSIVLYGVDEGILQVAGYRMPDPISYFFTKRALQVQTSQILDLLLPEMSIFESLSNPGGDEPPPGPVGLNLNPFKRKRDKPVVFWSGILKASEKEQTFTYEVPDYFDGNMKIMAVASSDSAVGTRSVASTIRGDVVISPNVPLFVTPGDEFEVSVGVSNTLAGSKLGKDIRLALEVSPHLEILSAKEKTLEIKEGSEKSETFRLRAKNSLGSASIKFLVNWKGKTTKSVTDLSLRPAIPFSTELHVGLIEDPHGKINVGRKMYPEFRTLSLVASEIPLSLAEGLMKYLEKYPYGCTEQTLSKAFPTLVLSKNPTFKISQDFVRTSYMTTLKILRRRQTSLGGFGLWDDRAETYDFISLYAAHYLTEANEAGLSEGKDLLDRSMEYLQSSRLEKMDSLHDARLWAYSLYLQARNGKVPKRSLESFRSLIESRHKDTWTADITAIYIASTLQLLKQYEEALKVMKSYKKDVKGDQSWNFFYGTGVRETQYLYLASLHFPELLSDMSSKDLLAMLNPILNGSYTTTNSSYAILALDAFVKSRKFSDNTNSDTQFVEVWKGGEKIIPMKGSLFTKGDFSDRASVIAVRNPKKQFVFWQSIEAGFDLTLPTKTIEDGIEIQREYLDDAMKPVTTVKNGDEIIVRMRARVVNSSLYSLDNIALVDLLPGGFEVVIDSIRGKPATEEQPRSTYSDRRNDEGGGGESCENDRDRDDCNHSYSDSESDSESYSDSDSDSYQQSDDSEYSSNTFPRSVDIREDRVLVFGSLSTSAQEFTYKIKATNVGKFTVAPPYAESMYDRSIRARGLGSKIEVVKPK